MSLISSQHLNQVSANTLSANVIASDTSVTADVVHARSVTALQLSATTARGGLEALSAAGAINPNVLTTTITGSPFVTLYTLAAGTAGQLKNIVYVAEAPLSKAEVTPNNLIGGSYIEFTDVGNAVTLVYTGTAWAITGANGVAVF